MPRRRTLKQGRTLAEYHYTIPALPPSNNKYIGRNMRWEYQEIKKQWAVLVRAKCRPAPDKPLEHASVTLHYFFPTRGRRDPDNYSGKMVLDGLVKSGIIADDSFDCIRLSISAGYDKANPRTEITIIEEKR